MTRANHINSAPANVLLQPWSHPQDPACELFIIKLAILPFHALAEVAALASAQAASICNIREQMQRVTKKPHGAHWGCSFAAKCVIENIGGAGRDRTDA